MRAILTIAINTYRETMRDRIFYAVAFLGVLYVLLSIFLATISLDQGQRMNVDFGLAGILIFGVVIGVFLGANLLYKEVVAGTALILFTKPVTRWQFIVGKFFGLAATLLVTTTILTLIFVGGYWYQNKSWPESIFFAAVFFSYLEVLLIVALAIVFGSFSTPISSSLYTLALFVVGHSYTMILRSAELGKNQAMIFLSKVVYYIMPNLEKFNLRTYATYSVPILLTEFWSAFLYALLYIILLLFLAQLALRKREF